MGRTPWKCISITFTLILLGIVAVIPCTDASGTEVRDAYDSLSDEERNAYDDLYSSVLAHETSREFKELTVDQGMLVYEALLCDHPELFWFHDSYQMWIYEDLDQCADFRYVNPVSPEQIATMQAEIDAAVSEMTDLTGTDAEKVKKIHDWLCGHIVYDEHATHTNDLYGALVLGRCVCEGYARAFDYLCDLNGIDSLYIRGFTYSSSTVGHAWNMVLLDDSWYYIDVTWDDDPRYTADNDYFLVGSQTVVNGRTFATEDHMADYEYGVVASEDAYPYYFGIFSASEWDTFRTAILIATFFLIFLLLAIIGRRRSRRMMRLYSRAPVLDTYGMDLFVDPVKCPYCGMRRDGEYDFCPRCGSEYPGRK